MADPQVQVLQMLSGDVDCEFRALDLRDLDLYKMGEERGNYRIRMWQTAPAPNPALIVNWSPPDPLLRALVRDQRSVERWLWVLTARDQHGRLQGVLRAAGRNHQSRVLALHSAKKAKLSFANGKNPTRNSIWKRPMRCWTKWG